MRARERTTVAASFLAAVMGFSAAASDQTFTLSNRPMLSCFSSCYQSRAPFGGRSSSSNGRKERCCARCRGESPSKQRSVSSVSTCLNMHGQNENDPMTDSSFDNAGESKRRNILHRLFLSTLSFPFGVPQLMIADAACLPGDTDTSCIGVYKVPMDDRILQYTSTPEQLKKFAPDLKWVPPVEPPKTYKEAVEELSGPVRERCASLKESVLRGKLDEAGVSLLGIMPRVTACGRVVAGRLYTAAEKQGSSKGVPAEDYSMKAYRISVALSDLEASLGVCDVLIGQGLRGDLGVSAPAQIQILAEINEINNLFEDFMRIVPSTI